MALELPDAHAAALDVTGRFVADVADEHWDQPTPCPDWSVRELVTHIVSGNYWVAPLVEGQTIDEVGDRFDGDILGDDALAAYDASAQAAAAAFLADGAMDAPCAVSYGPVPGSVYCGHRLIDVLIHGWDVAKATGQDTALPDDLVLVCFDVLAPQQELLQSSGMFGDHVDVSDDADPQTRLLAALGRRA
jgi:uncharacterized protein (TIGR03086 family)